MKNISLKIIPHSFEKQAWTNNFLVCGIDEVGRGCLAGPLVVTAAVLFKDSKHPYLKDSKMLREEQRLIAFEWLQKNSIYATAFISPRCIDKRNIYQATLYGMKKAVHLLLTTHPKLRVSLHAILVDAMPLKLSPSIITSKIPIHYFPFGEQCSVSIAAASIIAKVTRDEFMKTITPIFPSFNLKQHKGYGTAEHHTYLEEFGPTIIHRSSFLNRYQVQKLSKDIQTSLF